MVMSGSDQGLVVLPAPVETTAHSDRTAISFETYVRSRWSALLRTAFLLTGDRQLAEDLLQTTLAKVLRRWDGLAQAANPDPYVRKVMLNTALRWRRRHWRAERPTDAVPDQPSTDSTAGVDARERLRRALITLPARQRAVIVLRFYEDQTEVQTAALLGCRPGTVKSQTAKAMAKLRARLADQPDDSDDSNGGGTPR
jgi:RNA polymerase sigma-70 factor, ECF subfamily